MKYIKYIVLYILILLIGLICSKSASSASSVVGDTLYLLNTKIPVEGQIEPNLDALDVWIELLAECESGNDENIINWEDGGSPSYGYLQWKVDSFIFFNERYSILEDLEKEEVMNIIMDKDTQIALARRVIEDGGWRHWKNCSKKIGLDNVDMD